MAAALVVLAIVVIVAGVYASHHRGTHVPLTADGGLITLTCPAGEAVVVLSATYLRPDGSSADVSGALQTALAKLGSSAYTVSGAALGQPSGGKLTFVYRCEAPAHKSGFVPVPVSVCAGSGNDYYAVDATGRNAAGTVVWDPYSTQSRVSLERYAESAEAAEPMNPYTGIGKTASVRTMGDRYRRHEALRRLSEYELQPGDPGSMEAVSDGAMSLMTKIARRPAAAAAGSHSSALAATEIDSDYLSDGVYDDAVLKESLTSRRQAHPNTLTASKTGLGSIRMDPRFEPGPQARVPGGDASWSHGGAAGGPTSGGFAPATFMPGSTWDSRYVFAFGDRDASGRGEVEAVDTGRSQW